MSIEVCLVKMSFPNKETRAKCYKARDDLWQCLDQNNDKAEACLQFRKLFESNCPSQWVYY